MISKFITTVTQIAPLLSKLTTQIARNIFTEKNTEIQQTDCGFAAMHWSQVYYRQGWNTYFFGVGKTARMVQKC